MNAADLDAAVRLHATHGAMAGQDPLTDALCDSMCQGADSTLPAWLASTLGPATPPSPLPPAEGMWSIEAENPWVCLALYAAVAAATLLLSWAKDSGVW